MGRATHLVTNFTAGELSPLIDVRTDTAKYHNGAKEIRNSIVLAHGGATKRPGTMHVLPCYDTSFASRLERFEYSTEQAYMIEFAPGFLRFFKDRGIITGTAITITGATKANPCVITYTGADPTNGDQILITSVAGMTQLNNRIFTVANVNAGANTLELSGVNSTGYDTYTSGGSAASPVQLAHTYSNAEIDELWVTQSADTMYIFHPSHPARKLTRSSHTSWTLTEADIRNGPFRAFNGDNTHYLTVSPTGGPTAITNITKASPAVVTAAGHPFADGATVLIQSVGGMTQVNGNGYVVRNVTTNTFELWTQSGLKVDSTGYGTYTSGGTASGTSTPFGTIAPGTPVTLNSTDALFSASHVGALFRLWEPGQSTGMSFISEPPPGTQGIVNGQNYTKAGKVYGVIDLTGTAAFAADWQIPTHSDGIVKVQNNAGAASYHAVYLHDTSCVLKITAFSSSTQVTARVVRNHVPLSVVSAGTSFWEEGAWSAVRGYPRVGAFHKSRLFAMSSTSEQQNLWSSVVRLFEDFQDGADDDRGIVDQILSDGVEVARWAASTSEALLIGTAGGVQAVYGSTTGDSRGITPTNVNIRPQLPLGVSGMRPVRIGEAIFYGERNGALANAARIVNELGYNGEKFAAQPVTIISEHITGTGVTEGAFQATPRPVAWFRRTDGQIAGLTYDPGQEVRAWHLHMLGGATADYSYGECKRVASVPGADGDEPWFVVKRTINGASVHYIEFLTTGLLPTNDKEDCVYLDSALTYDGASTSSITGLYHLEGQTVYALVDGAKQGPFTVTNGKITLTTAGSLVHVGLRYTSVVETVDLDAAAVSGTAKTRAKLLSTVWPYFHRSLGGRIGPSTDLMLDLLFRTDSDLFGTSPELKTDFIEHDLSGGWTRKAVIRFEHDEPYPFTFLGVASEINTSG